MPSQEEKQRRKAIQNELRQKADVEKLAALPMPRERLQAFFDYLDQRLSEHDCDDTLHFTQEFAASHNLAFEPIKQWLGDFGGYWTAKLWQMWRRSTRACRTVPS